MKRTIFLSGIALLLLSSGGVDQLYAAGRDQDAYNPFDMDNVKKFQKGVEDAQKKRPDTGRNEANDPDLYETYQDCYVNNISGFAGISAAAGEKRKAVVKEYCRAVFTVKQRKAFTDCFTSQVGRGKPVAEVSRECAGATASSDR